MGALALVVKDVTEVPSQPHVHSKSVLMIVKFYKHMEVTIRRLPMVNILVVFSGLSPGFSKLLISSCFNFDS